MNPKRGDVYLLKGDAVGKQRPVVIISHNRLNSGQTVIAIPFSSQQLTKRDEQEWSVSFGKNEAGLPLDCVAQTEKISIIDKTNLQISKGAIGHLNKDQLKRLLDGVKWTLGIE